MSIVNKRPRQRVLALCLAFVSFRCAIAAPDEIQVYLDDVRQPREAGLELHLNYVLKGRSTPDYPGEIPPHHVFRATPEISMGLAPNWDMGLYLPWQTGPGGNVYSNLARLRLKYLASANETKPFFWGVNLEVGYVPLRVSGDRIAAELRGIFGYRNGPWLLAVNPIFGFAVSGPNKSAAPDFDLNVKVARDVAEDWAIGFEHYAGFGRLDNMSGASRQDHVFYAVIDFERKGFGVNFGIGRGLTGASDDWVLKSIISIPLKW